MTEVIIDVLVSAVLFASAFISIRSINGDKETTATVEKIKYTNHKNCEYEISFIHDNNELVRCTTIPYKKALEDLVGKEVKISYIYRNGRGPYVSIIDKRLNRPVIMSDILPKILLIAGCLTLLGGVLNILDLMFK